MDASVASVHAFDDCGTIAERASETTGPVIAVFDDDGALIGVVHVVDVAAALARDDETCSAIALMKPVSLMLFDDELISRALKRVSEAQADCALVMDHAGTIVGVTSAFDLLVALIDPC